MGLGFVAGGTLGNRRTRRDGAYRKRLGTIMTAADVEMSSLNLTPALEKMVSSLKMFPDSKVRYQQLLHYASTLGPMEPELKTEMNKVPGCLSTVFVHAEMNPDTRKVYFKGDSDAQLTKGLVSMLVNGLSGSTALQIEKVNPDFIKASGLTVSLTPGRNNGFINMLKLMKRKAAVLDEEAAGLGPRSTGQTDEDAVSNQKY
uniref:Fe-S metabolism associated domain-containing protein n=1 Tax=Rhodosorus marinus TaxID=101924 RepID=A0A7S3EAV2_9RHOD|mmetsp:Transcript_22121/g.89610  ORF Transcript_22121/g.89610 Transcript_22121/m.89610 type:complete len:202 (+) Transcript_22121:1409-2014(+)